MQVSGSIHVTVGTSFLYDSPMITNLNETIGHHKQVPRPLNRNGREHPWAVVQENTEL